MLLSKEEIIRGGSKLELAKALLETEFAPFVPKSAFFYYGQDISTTQRDIEDILRMGSAIVRGSSMFDWHGFIDVIPTYTEVTSIKDIESAIHKIEKAAKSNKVKQHIEDWNQNADIPAEWRLPYSPEVHVLIQLQNPSDTIGSILRHPHTGSLLINYDLRGSRNFHNAAVKKDISLYHRSNLNIEDSSIHNLIDLYERIEKILDSSYVYQMEFGLNPLQIFQIRPFKEKKQSERYNFDYTKLKDISFFNPLPFNGITPKEGIILKMQIVDDADMIIPSENYGAYIKKSPWSSPSLRSLRGLNLYLTATDRSFVLSHADYRSMKRACYSGSLLYDKTFLKGKFRYISDGSYALLMPA